MAYHIKRTPENGRTLSYADYLDGRYNPSTDSFAVTYYETVQPVLENLHIKRPERLHIRIPEDHTEEEKRGSFAANWVSQAVSHIEPAITDLRKQLAYTMTQSVLEANGVIDCWPQQLIPILRYENNVRGFGTDDDELNERARKTINEFVSEHQYFSFFPQRGSSWDVPHWVATDALPISQKERRINEIGTEIKYYSAFPSLLTLLFVLLLLIPGAIGAHTYLNGVGLLEQTLTTGPDRVQAFASSLPFPAGHLFTLVVLLPMMLLFVPLYIMLLIAQLNVTAAAAVGAALGLIGIVVLFKELLRWIRSIFKRASLRAERSRLRGDIEVRGIRKRREMLDACYPAWTGAWLARMH